MIPDNLGAVVGFLLLIAPGALWELLLERYVPTRRRTPLLELARVALVSLLATAIAAGILYVPFWSRVLESTLDPTSLLLASALTSAVGCLLVCGFSVFIHRGPAQIHGPGLLHYALKELPAMAQPTDASEPNNNLAFLLVAMDDGSMLAGSHVGHDLGPEEPHPQLALRGPITCIRTGKSKNFHFESEQEFMIVPLAKVTWIRVVPRPARLSSEDESYPGVENGAL